MADVPGDIHHHDADRWVQCGCGAKHWGANGAAGLLLWRAAGTEVLLQHRAPFSHFGGTWGLPGGARASQEDAIGAALREAAEEALISPHGCRVWATHELTHPDWSYTTVIAEDIAQQAGGIGDGESLDVRWVPVDSVSHLALLPAFEDAWLLLRRYLRPITLIVDMANLLGSRPDGWWRDRAGATQRLARSLSELDSVAAAPFTSELSRLIPEVLAVVEGQARGVDVQGVRIVAASGSGDDEIVAQARAAAESGDIVLAVTSDRELTERLAPWVLAVAGSGSLRRELD